MGGASYVLDNFNVKKLYSKVYYGNDKSTGTSKDNNTSRYNKLYEKAKKKDIFQKVNADLEGETITLGNMKIILYATKNLLYYSECAGEDENINSIITYITANGKKVLLTGDMEPTSSKCLKKFNSSCTGTSITECVVKTNNITKIDLLKLPHHGYSSCDINKTIVSKLAPKNIVIHNWSTKVNYYYKGVETDSGKTIGPVHNGLKSCRAQYFTDHPTSGDNKSAYYVNNKNVVFSLNGKNIESYNN
jgi:beta-lactamase superfamily II metal-dependent hydrolase